MIKGNPSEGLTRRYRIRRLKQHIDHPDPNISLKGLDQAWKLDGSYAPEKHMNVDFDYAANEAEIQRLQDEIEKLEEFLESHGEAEEAEFEELKAASEENEREAQKVNISPDADSGPRETDGEGA